MDPLVRSFRGHATVRPTLLEPISRYDRRLCFPDIHSLAQEQVCRAGGSLYHQPEGGHPLRC